MHQIRFLLGLFSRPHWGSLERSQAPLLYLRGPTSKGREEVRGGFAQYQTASYVPGFRAVIKYTQLLTHWSVINTRGRHDVTNVSFAVTMLMYLFTGAYTYNCQHNVHLTGVCNVIQWNTRNAMSTERDACVFGGFFSKEDPRQINAFICLYISSRKQMSGFLTKLE